MRTMTNIPTAYLLLAGAMVICLALSTIFRSPQSGDKAASSSTETSSGSDYWSAKIKKVMDSISAKTHIKSTKTETKQKKSLSIGSDGLVRLPAKIKRGDTVLVEYTLANVGKDTVFISDMEPHCGCTLVQVTKKTMPPLSMNILRVRFDSRELEGYFSTGATITVKESRDGGARKLYNYEVVLEGEIE